MVYMSNSFETAQVIQERRHNFDLFVKEQSVKGNPGMLDAALHSNGFRDSYGAVIFDKGRIHNGLWIVSDAGNDNVVIYTNREEARNYAKSLLPILKLYGYMCSKVWVEEIAVRHAFGNPLSGLMAPTEIFEDKDRYIIRMKVQK